MLCEFCKQVGVLVKKRIYLHILGGFDEAYGIVCRGILAEHHLSDIQRKLVGRTAHSAQKTQEIDEVKFEVNNNGMSAFFLEPFHIDFAEVALDYFMDIMHFFESRHKILRKCIVFFLFVVFNVFHFIQLR